MPFKIHKQGVTVQIRLTPGARRAGFGGLMDVGGGKMALKFSVQAPPEDGKANRALLDLLAEEWDLPKGALSLLSGETNRQKLVLAAGDGEKLIARLKNWTLSNN
jgi:uncharacterized protein